MTAQFGAISNTVICDWNVVANEAATLLWNGL